ncbi:hypothetical protein [Azospirillum endophyticum]
MTAEDSFQKLAALRHIITFDHETPLRSDLTVIGWLPMLSQGSRDGRVSPGKIPRCSGKENPAVCNTSMCNAGRSGVLAKISGASANIRHCIRVPDAAMRATR